MKNYVFTKRVKVCVSEIGERFEEVMNELSKKNEPNPFTERILI